MTNYIETANKVRTDKLLERAIESGNEKQIKKMRERVNAFKKDKKNIKIEK